MPAVEITVTLDFRCSYKSKNNGEKLLPRSLVMKLFEAKLVLLNEKTSYIAASIALVNGCIAIVASKLEALGSTLLSGAIS